MSAETTLISNDVNLENISLVELTANERWSVYRHWTVQLKEIILLKMKSLHVCIYIDIILCRYKYVFLFRMNIEEF
jgi:hypothetical protein